MSKNESEKSTTLEEKYTMVIDKRFVIMYKRIKGWTHDHGEWHE